MTDLQKRFRIYFSHPTVPVMAAIAAVGVSLGIRRADAGALAMFALGWAIYILEEHLVHRFIFHAKPPRKQSLFHALYRLHYGHHDQATNRHLLFTPLWFSLPLTVVSSLAMLAFFSLEDVIISVCGGGVCGYLLFEWLHLESHFKSSSKGRLGRYITRRHTKHHHIDYARWYTVSPGGQLVDKALGADPKKYVVVPNVRTCGLDADDPRLVKSRIRYALDTSLANAPAASLRRIGAEQAV